MMTPFCCFLVLCTYFRIETSSANNAAPTPITPTTAEQDGQSPTLKQSQNVASPFPSSSSSHSSTTINISLTVSILNADQAPTLRDIYTVIDESSEQYLDSLLANTNIHHTLHIDNMTARSSFSAFGYSSSSTGSNHFSIQMRLTLFSDPLDPHEANVDDLDDKNKTIAINLRDLQTNIQQKADSLYDQHSLRITIDELLAMTTTTAGDSGEDNKADDAHSHSIWEHRDEIYLIVLLSIVVLLCFLCVFCTAFAAALVYYKRSEMRNKPRETDDVSPDSGNQITLNISAGQPPPAYYHQPGHSVEIDSMANVVNLTVCPSNSNNAKVIDLNAGDALDVHMAERMRLTGHHLHEGRPRRHTEDMSDSEQLYALKAKRKRSAQRTLRDGNTAKQRSVESDQEVYNEDGKWV